MTLIKAGSLERSLSKEQVIAAEGALLAVQLERRLRQCQVDGWRDRGVGLECRCSIDARSYDGLARRDNGSTRQSFLTPMLRRPSNRVRMLRASIVR